MSFLEFSSLGLSYPSVVINTSAVLQRIDEEYGAVDVALGSLYAADHETLMEAVSEAMQYSIVDCAEEDRTQWWNTCNHESNFDANIQFCQIDIGNGTDCYDECLILVEISRGDPRRQYSGQRAFIGVLAETGLLHSNIDFRADCPLSQEDLEDASPGYCGRSDGLDTLLDNVGDIDGYSVVLDEHDCPLFDGEDLVLDGPYGQFRVSFMWDGECV